MIRNEAPVMLGITQGKRGWPPLQAFPEEPRAWADTPRRTIAGCALALDKLRGPARMQEAKKDALGSAPFASPRSMQGLIGMGKCLKIQNGKKMVYCLLQQ